MLNYILHIYFIVATFGSGYHFANTAIGSKWYHRAWFVSFCFINPLLYVAEGFRYVFYELLWEDVLIGMLQVMFWKKFYFTDEYKGLSEESLKEKNMLSEAFIKRHGEKTFEGMQMRRIINAINKRHNYIPKKNEVIIGELFSIDEEYDEVFTVEQFCNGAGVTMGIDDGGVYEILVDGRSTNIHLETWMGIRKKDSDVSMTLKQLKEYAEGKDIKLIWASK